MCVGEGILNFITWYIKSIEKTFISSDYLLITSCALTQHVQYAFGFYFSSVVPLFCRKPTGLRPAAALHRARYYKPVFQACGLVPLEK